MRARHCDGVRVHAHDLNARETSVKLLLHLLCSVSDIGKRTAAGRALRIGFSAISAMVTPQRMIGAMICQTHTAARAFIIISALAAGDKLTGSAAIQKQDRLFTAGKICFDFFTEKRAERAGIPLLQLLFQINDRYTRHCPRIVAAGDLKIMIGPLLGMVSARNIRRCRSEQKERVVLCASKFCDITSVVAGRLFGLIGLFLLFVNDQQSEL